jgi:hypothetical protein
VQHCVGVQWPVSMVISHGWATGARSVPIVSESKACADDIDTALLKLVSGWHVGSRTSPTPDSRGHWRGWKGQRRGGEHGGGGKLQEQGRGVPDSVSMVVMMPVSSGRVSGMSERERSMHRR